MIACLCKHMAVFVILSSSDDYTIPKGIHQILFRVLCTGSGTPKRMDAPDFFLLPDTSGNGLQLAKKPGAILRLQTGQAAGFPEADKGGTKS